MRIALTGNPNSGKTTMYNALTGRSEKVGNWAGVTVEKKEHTIKKAYYSGSEELIAVDLPGAYSMSPFTSEESITSSYVRKEHPDAIINIVDATNLSRSLFFTTQLLELGIPVVVALNKSDINVKKQTTIDTALLSEKLGCPVLETVSTAGEGLKTVVEAAAGLRGKGQRAPYSQGSIDLTDKKAVEEADRKRFDFVNQLVSQVETRKVLTREKGTGDAIDAVLTNKFFGIPIFAGIMFLVFQISQVWVGPYIADTLVAWIETFQGFAADSLADANPLLTALAIPGVMASRTIRNERERRATAMLTPFMPCGAKIPVIALFAGAFFDDAGWVSFLMYFTGIVLIFLGALLVNKIAGYKNRKSFFIIELPEYKVPSLTFALKAMCARGWAYIVKAATIILLCNTAVQVMQTFTWSFQVAETADSSILASIAHPFAYLLVPIVGVLSWQLAAAAVTGFIAKENVVGTLAVCFAGLENFIDTEELAMLEGSGAEVAGIIAITKVAALAYLMFNLYTPPCFAAIGAMNSEMKSAKWLWGGIGLQLGTGYTVGFLVYQIGTLITTGAVGAGFVPGLIAVAVFAGILIFLCLSADREVKRAYAGSGVRA